jgi:hypothetical protein
MDRGVATSRRIASVAVAPVPRLWPVETFVCIAGGPSLAVEDVAFCQGRARVIAVNDAYRLAPWADVLYAHDTKWWMHHGGVPSFQGLKYSAEMDSPELGVRYVGRGDKRGLSTDPSVIHHGGNSGYQAVNLAVHLGAKRICLLGYDMQLADDGREHWFGSHPKPVRGGLPLSQFISDFGSIEAPLQALGIEVVNCSRHTALHCFPRMTIEEAL